jgi:hypothetical protein
MHESVRYFTREIEVDQVLSDDHLTRNQDLLKIAKCTAYKSNDNKVPMKNSSLTSTRFIQSFDHFSFKKAKRIVM